MSDSINLPDELSQKLREICNPLDTKFRMILDTADEIERRTGVRPDVRHDFIEQCMAENGRPPVYIPNWFK